jgi:ABC-type ATPase with predicted acetyltransferase domain
VSESEAIVTYNKNARGVFALANEMFVERGARSDWELLHDLHYKAEGLPIGPQFWKLHLRGETVGVLVIGQPKGMLKERHRVFPNMAPGANETKLTNTNRFRHINQNFRVISRFVIDTRFRGIGAGYRMMNLVSRMDGHRFIEIQSSMSKFNIFGQKAGFKFVRPMNANKFEKGMKFFRSHFQASPQDFEAIVNEIEMSASRDKLFAECKIFYQRHSALENTGAARDRADGRVASMSIRDVVKGIQQMSLASPMYGIWEAPDLGREVPAVMPLTAFDCQKPTEPLRWKP